MFVDNGLRAGMRPESSHLERRLRFKARVVVLSLLTFLLYPFLWAWTIIGSLWFSNTQGCLPEEGQKWGFLIWLVFSYCALVCIACVSAAKVFLDLVRGSGTARANPIAMLQPNELASYPPGLFATSHGHNLHVLQAQQRERVERAIQRLPKMHLARAPEHASQCPICLDDFGVGSEVRNLPCSHLFHAACIDAWLRLNSKCPHCRASAFPGLDTADLPALPRLAASRSPRFPHHSLGGGGGRSGEGVVVVSVPSPTQLR